MPLLIVFQNDNGHELCLDSITSPQSFLSDIDITAEKISQAMHRVPNKLSQPPDCIPAFFWKRSYRYIPILQVILFLFKLSFSQGATSHQWKSAIAVPFFKKGFKYSPKNYRPISLTCVLTCVSDMA